MNLVDGSLGVTRKGTEKISRSVRAYVYLVLTSQVQVRSDIVGTSASAVDADAQEVFKSTFKVLIDEEYAISNGIQRYQDVLEHALSKVDFPVGTGVYMFPRNLNLKIGSTKGYNNKNLISSTEKKIGSNIEINKDKLPEPVNTGDDALLKNTVKEDHYIDKSRMVTEQHNDEKLAVTILIVGVGLITYHLWYKINGNITIYSRWCCGKRTCVQWYQPCI